ncbi:single-stranded-DNA-specific exonuclease RecJ [Thermoproteota archaeon]
MTNSSTRWILHTQNPALSSKISQNLAVHPIIAQILLNRQIRSLDQANQFLNPINSEYSINFEADLLEKSCALIQDCIKNKKKILIYGDYDADGITAVTMLIQALKKAGADADYHIPHRFHEGYGLNMGFVKHLAQSSCSLLIALDCGISNFKEIEYLNKQSSIKTMIFDHHSLPVKLPDANVIINPKTLAESHPLRDLCTAGIVYKFIEFFAQTTCPKLNPADFLDLAAIGTIADITPLTGENRRIVNLGLVQLSKRWRKGIDLLLETAQFKRSRISPRDVGFVIAPRLNASGRLAHAKLGVELLLASTNSDAEKLAVQLNQLNEKRRHLDSSVYQEAKASILENDLDKKHPVLTIASTGWHAGVIGITASKLAGTFCKPTVLISFDENTGRGSARSIGNINIYALLEKCQDLFIAFGGHKQAAGFSILPEKISEFQTRFIAVSQPEINPSDLNPVIEIDAKLSASDLNLELAETLSKLEPFGEGNPAPLFYTNDLIPIDFKPVGDGSHLKARFTNQENSLVIDSIGFGLSHKLDVLYKKEVELVFSLEVNEWNNSKSPQLNLVDIK